jgi:hypothetical protein
MMAAPTTFKVDCQLYLPKYGKILSILAYQHFACNKTEKKPFCKIQLAKVKGKANAECVWRLKYCYFEGRPCEPQETNVR